MAKLTNPSFRRRRLAKALRRLREGSGMSAHEAARAAGDRFSQSKISNIETLNVAVTGDDAYTLCQVYGADEKTTQALVQLARSARQRGWWHVSQAALGKAVDMIELEDDSVHIREFTIDLISGLLQTEDYARAVIRHADATAPNEVIEQRVQARLLRQKSFFERQVQLWAIVDEAALHRPIGGRKVMAAQLEHLAEIATTVPHVSLQVIPTDASGHPAMGVAFLIFNLADDEKYPYLDTLTGGAYIDDPEETIAYETAWTRLAASAVDFEKSAQLVREIVHTHRS